MQDDIQGYFLQRMRRHGYLHQKGRIASYRAWPPHKNKKRQVHEFARILSTWRSNNLTSHVSTAQHNHPPKQLSLDSPLPLLLAAPP